MGIETLITALAIGAGVGGGIAISKASSGGKSAAPSAPKPIPEAPKPVQAEEAAQESMRRRRTAQTQSVFTSPLGAAGEANVVRKTLLGQ